MKASEPTSTRETKPSDAIAVLSPVQLAALFASLVDELIPGTTHGRPPRLSVFTGCCCRASLRNGGRKSRA